MKPIVLTGVLAAMMCLTSAVTEAQPTPEAFYKGKTFRIITGFGGSSGYTTWARLIGRHIGKHIPGRPTVIVQEMTGASGVRAANYIYNNGSKDGLEIAAVAREAAALAISGTQGILYDVRKLNWLGTPTTESNICVFSNTTGVSKAADLFGRETIVGSDGIGSGMHIFPTAMNNILGTRFRIIGGYADSGQVLLAVERGELEGACQSVETLTLTRGEEIKSGKWKVVLQGGVRNSQFPDATFVPDLANTDEQRRALDFLYAGQIFGRPYIAPPGVVDDRLLALKKAFADTMSDNEFLDEAAKQRLKVSPILSSEMEQLVGQLAETPREIVNWVNSLLNPNNP